MASDFLVRIGGFLLLVVSLLMMTPLLAKFSITLGITAIIFIIFGALLIKKAKLVGIVSFIMGGIILIGSIIDIFAVFPSNWIGIGASIVLAGVGIWAWKAGHKFHGFLMIIIGAGLVILNIMGLVIIDSILNPLINLIGLSFMPIVLALAIILSAILVFKGGGFFFKLVGIILGLYGLIKVLALLNINFLGFGFIYVIESFDSSSWWPIILLFISIALLFKGTSYGEMSAATGAGYLARKGWDKGRQYGGVQPNPASSWREAVERG